MWVARDAWKWLKGFSELPNRDMSELEWASHGEEFDLPNDLFPDLKWEDEPIQVELVEVKR